MSYRNGNYAAFYVEEPFTTSNLGANQKPDFRYYNLIKAFNKEDSDFNFNDSHEKNYNVRDGSNWETLKERLRERLRNSKNIILFLSEATKESKALKEEIEYGILKTKLPIIIVYPDCKRNNEVVKLNELTDKVKKLWNNLPILKKLMREVPTLHVPMKKDSIKKALEDKDFTVYGNIESGEYFYTTD